MSPAAWEALASLLEELAHWIRAAGRQDRISAEGLVNAITLVARLSERR